MDGDDLKTILRSAGVDIWTVIEKAIDVAVAERGPELRARRDGFVERLYASASAPAVAPSPDRAEPERARSSTSPFEKAFGSGSPATPQSDEEEEVEIEEEEGDYSVDREQRMLLSIKDSLEEPNQSDEETARLLQKLVDMDVTFKALQETDIGRHVNKMRKHRSSVVRELVKILVRKWKEIVDEWVKIKSENSQSPAATMTDGDSPLQVAQSSNQNGHQVSDLTYSPNPHYGRLSSEEPKTKAFVKREAPAKPVITPAKLKEQKESLVDSDRLALARKRLQENYQEAQNAKKQRTIQVMGIDEIPKPKNGFISRKGFQSKHR